MTVVFRIKIDRDTHEVRVDVPSGQSARDLQELALFAAATACLEHSGYLPKGVVSAVD